MTQENGLDFNNQEQNKGKLTHFNEAGEAHMVDVHAKDDTYRVAKACGTIKVNGAVYRAVSTGTAKKGDVLAVARIAGIMGAKNNSMLIPLCHAIAMTKCDVEFELDEKNSSITAICTTACVGKTGVEMEAMTGSVWRFLPYMICVRHWTVAWKSGRYICWKNPVARADITLLITTNNVTGNDYSPFKMLRS